MKQKALLFSAIVLLLAGCQKYEDGPFISFRSKTERISNIWNFRTVTTSSGSNISDEYNGWRMAISDDGIFEIDWVLLGQSRIQPGTWDFNDDKTKLIITYENTALEQFWPKSLTINRLKEKDLILRSDTDQTLFEFTP